MNRAIRDIYSHILKAGRPVKVIKMHNNQYTLIIGWDGNYPGTIDTGYAKFVLTPEGAHRV
jgi:hypothetical protein